MRFSSNLILCSKYGRTSCWKHIFKFEPNLTTFYYIQKFEPSIKTKRSPWMDFKPWTLVLVAWSSQVATRTTTTTQVPRSTGHSPTCRELTLLSFITTFVKRAVYCKLGIRLLKNANNWNTLRLRKLRSNIWLRGTNLASCGMRILGK